MYCFCLWKINLSKRKEKTKNLKPNDIANLMIIITNTLNNQSYFFIISIFRVIINSYKITSNLKLFKSKKQRI